MSELQHLHVVITRPMEQAEPWSRDLRARGADTSLLPVLEIVPLSEADQRQAAKQRILALTEYQKVVFVSRNAVHYALDWIDRYWPQMPVGIRYFAVGSATAATAREAGLTVEEAGEAMNSEALLALPGLQAVAHEKILICRGVGGRGFLAESLRQRGAQVDFCELYQRQLPAAAGAALGQVIAHWQATAQARPESRLVLVAHSGESLENLHRLLQRLSEAQQRCFYGSWLVVPVDRVAELAADLGFSQVKVAVNAADDAMTEALAALASA